METTKVFDSMLLALAASGGTSSGGSKGGKKARGKEEIVSEVVADLLGKLREEFDMEYVGARYPTDPKESMNTVLYQELARYNRLLAIIRTTLNNVAKGMKGLVVMNATLEGVASDLWVGKVPDAWKGRSFASRKPLGAYYSEFLERIRMLDTWIEHGAPPIFWISGFFFPQSFLTGVTQNFARKFVIPVDDVVFDPEMCGEGVTKDSVKEKPADGCYVYGMFLEGCRWSFGKVVLDESEPKVLFSSAPTMLLRPCRTAEVRVFPSYSCPWYRTADRRGVLATTGHSSNYIGRIPMPIDKTPDHCAFAQRARCSRGPPPAQSTLLSPTRSTQTHTHAQPTAPRSRRDPPRGVLAHVPG
jgi:dynein heavy chain